MPLKYSTELRTGNLAIIDTKPCIVKSIDISKTGKHGHAKARIEAVGVFDSKKKIIVIPGSEKVEIPIVEKKKAQVLSFDKQNNKANIMDLENFETFDSMVDKSLEELQEGAQVEYWIIEEKKIIKRLA